MLCAVESAAVFVRLCTANVAAAGLNLIVRYRISYGRELRHHETTVGLHHVSAIASDPQANLDFYTRVLGLRFVKKTVNFDDPGTYHFYFGDDEGTPGTILTFFAWPGARRGLVGAGEVTHTAFSVPRSSLDYWQQRLAQKGVLVEHTGRGFEEDVLTLADPDGMKIELARQLVARAFARNDFAK